MMDLAEENRKRAEFIEILADLSKDVNMIKIYMLTKNLMIQII